MWPKEYKNYPEDQPLKQHEIEPGKGIIGCEMHDLNGWGLTVHQSKKGKKRGMAAFLARLLEGDRPEDGSHP